MNKRILSILLCLMLVASLLVMAVPVSAADATFEVTADKTEAKPGDTINFTVKLNQATDLNSLSFELDIPAGLTFVSDSGALDSGAKSAMQLDGMDWTESIMTLSGYGHIKDTTFSDITLMTFQCTVDNDATGTVSVSLKNYELYESIDLIPHTGNCTPASIKVAAPTEPATEPATEPETEPATEPATEAETEAETQAETEAETQAPQLTRVPEVPATYDTPGVKEHYVDASGNKFSDATGLVPVTDEELYISPLGPTEPATEPATEAETIAPATEAETTAPATEAETTAPATEAETEAVTEAVTEPVTEASTEDATIVVPTVDPADPTDAPAPATEAGTEAVAPVTDPTSSDATEAGGAATGDSASKDSATSDSSATSTSSTPTTGDSTHMYLWMIIMLASLAGACAVLYTAKRKGIFNK